MARIFAHADTRRKARPRVSLRRRSRSAPGSARRRRSAPSRRRRQCGGASAICTARSSPWTPRTRCERSVGWQATSVEATEIHGHLDVRGSGRRRAPGSARRAAQAQEGAPSLAAPGQISPGIWVSSPGGPSTWTALRSGKFSSLPKVGPALAHRILANRDSLGPFGSLDELRRVKGVGDGGRGCHHALRDVLTPPRQSRENERDGAAPPTPR